MGRKYIIEIIGGEEGDMDFSTIEPYTEPDLERVRKEAYQKGLSDAWEVARKVTQVRKYGGYGDCLGDVFGRTDTPWDVFDYSASEVIEKIRQYEQEKEEIQVGDEVISPNGKGVVTEITDIYVRIMYAKGSGQVVKSEDLTKTGRHFPEIAEVLQKMKEANNG